MDGDFSELCGWKADSSDTKMERKICSEFLHHSAVLISSKQLIPLVFSIWDVGY